MPVVESPNSHAYDTIVPSGSEEADALNVTTPPGFTGEGLRENAATGGRGPDAGCTTTSTDVFAASASLSTTVRLTRYVPAVAYAWVAFTPLPEAASPNSQEYETIVPSGSYDAEASKETGTPGVAGLGLAVKEATGGWGGARAPEAGD